MNAGYKGLINQLSPGSLQQFKKEHLAEVAVAQDGDSLWLVADSWYCKVMK
ncbi:MAG: hypothetical protein OCD01_04865 [Fibrobacterales bacterium]